MKVKSYVVLAATVVAFSGCAPPKCYARDSGHENERFRSAGLPG
jgi:hypothetical protein